MANAPFKVTSLKFLERLKQLKVTSAIEELHVTLQVPDELFWWVYLEYGTGIRGDYPTEAYTIEAKNARVLRFFDVAAGEERFSKSVVMPGIPAFHMITSIQEDVKSYMAEFFRNNIKRVNYNLEEYKALVYNEMMPKIKDMIINSFQENLPNHIRPYGRLEKTATQAFEEGLEIV